MTQAALQDLTSHILQLAQSLSAYRRLHTEELDGLTRRLAVLKREVLASSRTRQMQTRTEEGHERDMTSRSQ